MIMYVTSTFLIYKDQHFCSKNNHKLYQKFKKLINYPTKIVFIINEL